MPVAIPGLAVTAAALLALLILWGVKTFGEALAAIVPKGLPIVGDSIHNVFRAVAVLGAAACQWIMANTIRPVINLVVGPIVSFIDWLTGIALLAQSVAGQLTWLVSTALPHAFAQVRGFVHKLVDAARVYARTIVHTLRVAMLAAVHAARTYALSLYHRATSYAATIVHALRAYAVDIVHTLRVDLTRLVHLARVYAVTLVHALRVDLVADVTRLEKLIKASAGATTSYVTSAVNAGIVKAESIAVADMNKLLGYVDVEVTAAVAAVWPEVIDVAGELDGVIGIDLPDIGAAIKAIPRAVPLDQVGAIAAVGAIALPLLRYLRTCGVPNCRNLSKYGRDLQDLLGAVAVGGLMAFFAEMITDPDGAAAAVSDTLGPIGKAALGEAADLLGVG